jgi:ligand-binding SRPBCC domain-containing protein
MKHKRCTTSIKETKTKSRLHVTSSKPIRTVQYDNTTETTAIGSATKTAATTANTGTGKTNHQIEKNKPITNSSSVPNSSSSTSSSASSSASTSSTTVTSSSSSSSTSTVQYAPFEKQMNYIHRHEYLTPGTRSILIDWLIDVAAECSLESVTLGCAVGLVDRCLAVCDYRQRVDLDNSFTHKRSDSDSSGNGSDIESDCASESTGTSDDGMLVIGSNTLQLLGW